MQFVEHQRERVCQTFPDTIDLTRFDTFPEHIDFTMTAAEATRARQTGGATITVAAAT